MLLRDRLGQPVPALQIGRDPGIVFRLETPGRGGARHYQQLGTVERGQRGHDGVPSVLADHHCGTPPGGIERRDVAPRLDEPFFVEHAVGGKEHLAMHVTDAGVWSTEGAIQGRIVEPIAPYLVEPDRHVERWGSTNAVPFRQVRHQFVGRQRQLGYTTFEEVPRQRRFREDQQIGNRIQRGRLAEDLPQTGEVLLVGSLSRPELDNGDVQHCPESTGNAAWRSPLPSPVSSLYSPAQTSHVEVACPGTLPLAVPWTEWRDF